MKAVFLDIDGTLLDTPSGLNDISTVNKEAIISTLENHLVFIATGRTKCFIVEPIRIFPFSGFVTCNGAYVEYKNQCIYKRVISVRALKVLLSVCQMYHFDYYIEGYDKIYVNDLKRKSILDFATRWEMAIDAMVDTFDVEDIETYIAMIKVNSEDDFAIVNELLAAHFDIVRHPRQLSFDLNIKGINKGEGIKALVKHLSIDIHDTYAFGDGHNDIEMLSVVGYPVAMENAVEPLKKIAKMMTDSVIEDGVAKGLKACELY